MGVGLSERDPATRRAYDDALAYLFARTGGGSKYGLERTLALLDALENPHRRLRTFHVAGTNGKGSVVATLEALLRGRGLRVARYTSPHLIDFRERIVIDGAQVSATEITQWVHEWTPTVERLGATFFEATTAMAFDMFARARVDVAVIETGLGGRLDSTNVIDPIVATVTSVGLDHTEFLGNTVESIAVEKAGIFKRGRPAVIGELDPHIRELLVDRAHIAGASSVHEVAREVALHAVQVDERGTACDIELAGERTSLVTPLAGRHQAQNLATALLTLHAAGAEWSMSLADAAAHLRDVQLIGRFQRVGNLVLDVAHNPAGVEVLARTLAEMRAPSPRVALLTVLADKDWRSMMATLAPVVDLFIVTSAPTAPASRAWNPAEALAFADSSGWPAILERDFDAALERASLAATTIITGSFHTVGDALQRLPLALPSR